MNRRSIWGFLGINRTILALSSARMGDGIANSSLFVMIPLYAAQIPDGAVKLPLPLVVGVLVSAYGAAAAIVAPAPVPGFGISVPGGGRRCAPLHVRNRGTQTWGSPYLVMEGRRLRGRDHANAEGF